MKIRNGFVTNSSSSSFVIAIKNDITEVEKQAIYEKHGEPARQNVISDYDCDDEDITRESCFEDMFPSRPFMKLDDWNIHTGWASSEDGPEDAFLYYLANIEEDKYNFGSYC